MTFTGDKTIYDLLMENRETVCPKLNNAEIAYFATVCERTKLDPLKKQIYAIPRGEGDNRRLTIQTSIDGYRIIAVRTGEYEGQTRPQWYDANGKTYDIWLFDDPPFGAEIGVWRKGFREPTVRPVRWSAYVQTTKAYEDVLDANGKQIWENNRPKRRAVYRDGKPVEIPNEMWNRMGAEQILKCGEALSLRASFPDELGGIYTSDEVEQADNNAHVIEETDGGVKVQRPLPSNPAPSQERRTEDVKPNTTSKPQNAAKTPEQAQEENDRQAAILVIDEMIDKARKPELDKELVQSYAGIIRQANTGITGKDEDTGIEKALLAKYLRTSKIAWQVAQAMDGAYKRIMETRKPPVNVGDPEVDDPFKDN